MAIRMLLELGHKTALRETVTPDGLTHDYWFHVQGYRNANIGLFVKRIIVNLPEGFPNRKLYFKKSPYWLCGSASSDFTIYVSFYFRYPAYPRKVLYKYDIHLQSEGPRILYHAELRQFLFEYLTEDFAAKLYKCGGEFQPEFRETRGKIEPPVAVLNFKPPPASVHQYENNVIFSDISRAIRVPEPDYMQIYSASDKSVFMIERTIQRVDDGTSSGITQHKSYRDYKPKPQDKFILTLYSKEDVEPTRIVVKHSKPTIYCSNALKGWIKAEDEDSNSASTSKDAWLCSDCSNPTSSNKKGNMKGMQTVWEQSPKPPPNNKKNGRGRKNR